MGVDVIDVLRRQTRVLHGGDHAAPGAVSVVPGGHGVEGVVVAGAARHLRQNDGVSFQGVFLGLQNQGGAALAHHEAVPLRVKGTAGGGRVRVVGEGQGPGQALEQQGAAGGLAAHDHHGVRLSGTEQGGGGGDGVVARGTGGADGETGALDLVGDGELSRRDVPQNPGHQLGPHPGAFLGQLALGPLNGGQARQSGAHDDTGAVGVCLQAAGGQGLLGGDVGVLHKVLHAVCQLGGHVVFCPEVLHFSGHLDGQRLHIQLLNGVDTGNALNQAVPVALHAHPDGGDRAHAGDHNLFAFHTSLPHFPFCTKSVPIRRKRSYLAWVRPWAGALD